MIGSQNIGEMGAGQEERRSPDPRQGIISPQGRDFAVSRGVAFLPERLLKGMDVSLVTLS
jgi:hypothetical protein